MKGLENGFEKGNPKSEQMVLDALNDPFWKMRIYAIETAESLGEEAKAKAKTIISNLVVNDAKSDVRSSAVAYLASNNNDVATEDLLKKAIKEDQSYQVIGTALTSFTKLNPTAALEAAKQYENATSAKMLSSVAQVYGLNGTAEQADFFAKALDGNVLSGFDQLTSMNAYTLFNSRMEVEVIEKSVPVYKALGESGGYYTKMFIGRNMDYLNNNLEERLEELEYDLGKFEENNDAALADQNRKKIAQLKSLMEKLKAVPTK